MTKGCASPKKNKVGAKAFARPAGLRWYEAAKAAHPPALPSGRRTCERFLGMRAPSLRRRSSCRQAAPSPNKLSMSSPDRNVSDFPNLKMSVRWGRAAGGRGAPGVFGLRAVPRYDAWERDFDAHRTPGLRTTRIQAYHRAGRVER
jgi:hypothetical protein